MKIVAKPFEENGIQFRGGDKYFVVQYYDRVKLKDDPNEQHSGIFKLFPDNTKACIFSHLVVRLKLTHLKCHSKVGVGTLLTKFQKLIFRL